MFTTYYISLLAQITLVTLHKLTADDYNTSLKNWTLTNIERTLSAENKPVLHYDIVFTSDKITFELFDSAKWIFSQYQISSVRHSNLEKLTIPLKNTGYETTLRTGIFLHPENLSDAFQLCKMLSRFYEQSNSSFDRQLLVVITWTRDGQSNKVLGSETLRELATNFPIDSLVYFVVLDDKNSTWEIYSVKGVGISQKVLFNRIKTIPLPTHRHFGAVPIIATSVGVDPDLNDPVAAFRRREDGTLEFSRGCSVSVLRDLAKTLNFTIIAKNVSAYMQDYPNGTVDGEGELLMKGEADISIYLTYFARGLSSRIQPLVPICEDSIQVFFRPPLANSVRNIFMQPFSTGMWIAIMITCFLLAFSFIIIYRIEKHFRLNLSGNDRLKFTGLWRDKEIFRLDEPFFWILCIMCLKSYYVRWMEGAQKIVMMCAMIYSGVLYSAYCSSIISTLSVDADPIKYWNQVVELGYTILAEPNVHYADFLFNREENRSRVDYEKKLKINFVSDEDSVKKVFEGKFAYFSTMDVVAPIAWDLNYTDQQICSQIRHIPLEQVRIYCGFHVKKGSSLAQSFNSKLLQLMEKGLTSKYIANLYSETKPYCNSKFTSYHNISLLDSFFAFALLLIGILLSFIGLFVERSSCRKKIRRTENTIGLECYAILKPLTSTLNFQH